MTEQLHITPTTDLPEHDLLQREPLQTGAASPTVAPLRPSRREPHTYANALYVSGDAESPLDWLNQHSPLVTRAIAKVAYAPSTAYDLGCGTGRHALTMARRLHPESRVIAVDSSASAVLKLRSQAHKLGLSDRVHAVAANVEHFHLPHQNADLIVAASALRPVTNAEVLEQFLYRCRQATRPGGINSFILGCNRAEILPSGKHLPNPCIGDLDLDDARRVVTATYDDWEQIEYSEASYLMPDQRDDRSYTLRVNVLRCTVRRPARG